MPGDRSTSSLFDAGGPSGNVVLNWSQAPRAEFELYASAFCRAARELTRSFDAKQGHSDSDACPIVFLYRHATELYLKAAVIRGSLLFLAEGSQPPFSDKCLAQHRLEPLLRAFDQICTKAGWSDTSSQAFLQELEELILQLEEVDPHSFAFRYPANKKGERSLPHHSAFNVIQFARRIDPIMDLLAGATTGLQELLYEATQDT